MNVEKVYVGSELKFKITITASGFDMATDKFEVDLVCGKVTTHLDKTDLILSEGSYYIPIDTSLYPRGGDLFVITTAHVPDPDFDDNVRKEIDKQQILKINKL